MKLPTSLRTMRFKFTAFNAIFLTILLVGLGIGIAFVAGSMEHTESIRGDEPRAPIVALSIIAAVILGIIGISFLARRLLKPIDSITALAERISHTNFKLRINHEGANDEIKRFADTFDSMLARLETAFESQKQFMQDASHELKTPITIFQSNIEAINMQDNPSLADYKNLVDILARNTERMKNVYNSLILLLEDDQNQLEYSVTDIAPILGEVVAENKASAELADISLELQVDTGGLSVPGDPTRLKMAVNNLVENAIKYNRPAGIVSVTAYSDDSHAVIRVKDSGIGIAEDEQQRIFDRFYCVDKSRARDLGGSGLGLSIVKKIAEEYNGSVSVESTLGQGSTFSITLPLYKSA